MLRCAVSCAKPIVLFERRCFAFLTRIFGEDALDGDRRLVPRLPEGENGQEHRAGRVEIIPVQRKDRRLQTGALQHGLPFQCVLEIAVTRTENMLRPFENSGLIFITCFNFDIHI